MSRVIRLRKYPDHTGLVLGPGIRGVMIEPNPDLIVGKLATLANAADVEPITIPGYWTHKEGFDVETGATPQPGEKVLYHLHGGAYQYLTAHPNYSPSPIVTALLGRLDGVQRAFATEYRLTSIAPLPLENPFPAALLDAVAGYNYLVNVIGFAPENIIVDGDSAGGNLSLALIRYLHEYSLSEIAIPQPPGHLLLLSPWVDLGPPKEALPKDSSTITCRGSDFITAYDGGALAASEAFLGPHGLGFGARSAYVSPASAHPAVKSASYAGWPKTIIVSGGAEVLRDQIRVLYERMKKYMGDGVVYYEEPDAMHDFLVFDWYEPQRSNALNAVGQWFASP